MYACRQGAVSTASTDMGVFYRVILAQTLGIALSDAALLEAYEPARRTLAGGGEGRQCRREGRSSAGCGVAAGTGRDRNCGWSGGVICFVDGH